MNKAELIAAIGTLAEEKGLTFDTDGKNNDELKAILKDLEAPAKVKPAADDDVTIQFVAPYRNYANGDIATFKADKARKILELKPAPAKEYEQEEAE